MYNKFGGQIGLFGEETSQKIKKSRQIIAKKEKKSLVEKKETHLQKTRKGAYSKKRKEDFSREKQETVANNMKSTLKTKIRHHSTQKGEAIGWLRLVGSSKMIGLFYKRAL